MRKLINVHKIIKWLREEKERDIFVESGFVEGEHFFAREMFILRSIIVK